MPRAFDRGIPDVDKNPLISATTWGDPDSVIGEAAYGAGTRIQTFLFGLFTECGEFVTGLGEFGATFLTDLLETVTADLEAAMAELDIDGDLVAELQATIDRISAQLASPNPLVLLGAGLQAFIDSIWRLFNCPDPEAVLDALTPDALAANLGDIIGDLTDNPFVQGLVALADFLGDSVNNFIRDAIIGGGRLIEILCGIFTCDPTAALTAAGIAEHSSGITGTTPFTLIAGILEVLTPIIESPFVQGLVAVAEWLGRETGNFARDVFEGAIGVADWVCGILTCQPLTTPDWPDFPSGVTTPLSLLKGFSDRIAPIIINPFIQGVIAFADDVGVAVGDFFRDLFNGALAFVEGLCSLVTLGELPEVFGNWSNTPAQIIDQALGIVNQLLDNPITNGLRDLIEGSGNLLEDTIGGLIAFINELVGLLGRVMSGPQAIIDFLGAILGANGLDGWIESLPFIGPLVAKLTGFDSSGDFALDLTSLGNWAAGLLTGASPIPAANLIGSIPQAILGAIPVSSINFTAGNLLSQGEFVNANTVEAGGGWAWDGTTTATGSGGSVKATATGSLQQLYSRQTIKVAAGDRIDVSAVVKTSGFTAASGRNMILSVIPWIGTTAQTAHVVHTRTTAASTFQPMTGLRLRIGGTAESGEVALSGSITALTVRLAVTANSGAHIWFDNVEVKKAGALAQTLVEYLTTTWEQAWTAVFGSGGTGKIWSDFITTVTTVFDRAKLGVTNAGNAQGTAIGIIDGVGQAIFGDSAYASLPQTVKQSIRKLVGTLFGVSNPVLTEILSAAVPDLDGSIITTGTVDTGRLDTDGIGAEINPTSGSGALLSRKDTTNVNGNIGRFPFSAGFYTHLDRASTDISAMTTGGVPGTGARSDYSGIFRVSNAGWYMCEVSVRLNATFASGQKVAPALFKGTNLTDLAVFKIGADTLQGARYAQSTFIVYLNANETVQAGFDGAGFATNIFDADASGVETYFSISLLNKTYA